MTSTKRIKITRGINNIIDDYADMLAVGMTTSFTQRRPSIIICFPPQHRWRNGSTVASTAHIACVMWRRLAQHAHHNDHDNARSYLIASSAIISFGDAGWQVALYWAAARLSATLTNATPRAHAHQHCCLPAYAFTPTLAHHTCIWTLPPLSCLLYHHLCMPMHSSTPLPHPYAIAVPPPHAHGLR